MTTWKVIIEFHFECAFENLHTDVQKLINEAHSKPPTFIRKIKRVGDE